MCGSDGATYNSECDLHRTACLQNNAITVKHEGICFLSPNTLTSTQSKSSCDTMNCPHGALCVAQSEAIFTCECPQCSEGK